MEKLKETGKKRGHSYYCDQPLNEKYMGKRMRCIEKHDEFCVSLVF